LCQLWTRNDRNVQTRCETHFFWPLHHDSHHRHVGNSEMEDHFARVFRNPSTQKLQQSPLVRPYHPYKRASLANGQLEFPKDAPLGTGRKNVASEFGGHELEQDALLYHSRRKSMTPSPAMVLPVLHHPGNLSTGCFSDAESDSECFYGTGSPHQSGAT
jgi:hypothetical protein